MGLAFRGRGTTKRPPCGWPTSRSEWSGTIALSRKGRGTSQCTLVSDSLPATLQAARQKKLGTVKKTCRLRALRGAYCSARSRIGARRDEGHRNATFCPP